MKRLFVITISLLFFINGLARGLEEDEKYILHSAGKDLQSFALHNYIGVGASALGMALAFAAVGEEDDGPLFVAGALGLTGFILLYIVAPSKVASAGKKLEELGTVKFHF